MNRFNKIDALHEAIRAWVAKQAEPFATAEFAGRFNLRHRTALRYIGLLLEEGRIRKVTKEQFAQCAVYARAT